MHPERIPQTRTFSRMVGILLWVNLLSPQSKGPSGYGRSTSKRPSQPYWRPIPGFGQEQTGV
jgi:hypothetical protein